MQELSSTQYFRAQKDPEQGVRDVNEIIEELLKDYIRNHFDGE